MTFKPDLLIFVAWSYGISAVAFAAFLVQLAVGWRKGARAKLLLISVASTAAWAAAIAAFAVHPFPYGFVVAAMFDTLRMAAWFSFIGTLLAGGVPSPERTFGRLRDPLFWLVALLLVGSNELVLGLLSRSVERPERYLFAASLGVAITGLAFLEQLYRRTPESSRWGVKPLCLGLAIGFGYDLVLYADALLFSQMDPDLWAGRGLVYAIGLPLIAMATARNKSWTVDIAVSRGVVKLSGVLLASAVYLLIAAGAGYYLKYFGGSWGRAMQAVFGAAAVLAFVALALSGSARARLRVLVSKHFFSYRFDYREEWLRFTRTLATSDSGASVYVLCVKALADLVESPSGRLWIRRADRFVPAARWNLPESFANETLTGELTEFLQRTGWVIDIPECRETPSRYGEVALPPAIASATDAWLLVPLMSGSELIGIVMLMKPRARLALDWEVRDVLSAAGRQAATYAVQAEATAALLEAEKFDAFNRMSAFVVHDLRNLVAQLTLLLRNSERHQHNPEFQKDMLDTVRHVVTRMGDLMLQLRTGSTPVEVPRPVDLAAVVGRIREAKLPQGRSINFESSRDLYAFGHEDRLEHVIGHLVQNAIDATTSSGRVVVRTYARDRDAVIEVEDDGVGMTEQFVGTELFRPFQTTKVQGMGIGMYESRQYIQALGGTIQVESAPGAGTTVRVALPKHVPGLAASKGLQEAA